MKLISPPRILFLASGFIYSLIVYFSVQIALSTPWLGLNFSVDEATGAIYVDTVDATGPAASIITASDNEERFVAIIGANNRVPLTAKLIKEMPYNLDNYSQYNHFFQHQTQVFELLKEATIQLQTDKGVLYTFSPEPTRPLGSLSIMFWLQLLVGGVLFYVSMAVLMFSSDESKIVNTCFFVSGLSFLVLSSVVAAYSSRELSLDGELFRQLAMTQYFASLSFVLFFVSIFCFYPMRAKNAKALMITLGMTSLISLLHVFQVFESLLFSVYSLFYLVAIFGIFFISLQYNYTRGFIVERASLRWLVYALITGDVLFFIISIAPLVASLDLIHKQFFYWVALLCVYVGVALGLKKYKLFKLELWAIYSWVWMFGGLVVLGLAVILISVFKINSMIAVLFSVLVIGWLYFPLRHWLWENYAFGFNRTQYQDRLPELLEIILSSKSVRSSQEQWEFLLRQVFDPVLVMHETDGFDEVVIKESGAVLHIPEFDNIPAIGLAGVERGSRLFNQNDIRFLNSMMILFENAQKFKGAYEQGVHEERTRIARDLHDDVAARLLTLIHKSEGTPQEPLAREALVTLRESINSLGGRREQKLDDILRELHVDIEFRLEAVNIKLHWNQDRQMFDRVFNSRQATNFKRVAQEIVTNILKHANATTVNIDCSLADEQFTLMVCDDGRNKFMKDWVNGRGVHNIRTRMNESGGSVRWNQRIIDEQLAGTCVEISIPF